MRPLLHRAAVAALVAAVVLVPSVASAVSVDEIVALARSGVTDTVILALIDRDKTIFALQPDDLVALKSEGVSEPVILAMLKSGREEADRAVQAESDLRTAMYLAERSPGPELLVVDSARDQSSGAPPSVFYASPTAVAPVYSVPYIVAPGIAHRRGRALPAPAPYTTSFPSPFHAAVVPPTSAPVIPPVARAQTAPAQPPMLCRAEVNTASSAFPLTTIVECPPVMQRRR